MMLLATTGHMELGPIAAYLTLLAAIQLSVYNTVYLCTFALTFLPI